MFNMMQVRASIIVGAENVLIVDMNDGPGGLNLDYTGIEPSPFFELILASPNTSVPFHPSICLNRPERDQDTSIRTLAGDIVNKIKARSGPKPKSVPTELKLPVEVSKKVILFAASTGGTEALPVVFEALPANMPPILIVQHIPPVFAAQFSERLDRISKVTVKEAKDGDVLRPGLALVAPGGKHMKMVRKDGRLSVECFVGDKVHGVMPAADVLFLSAAPLIGKDSVTIILTGMGEDGARGMEKLRQQGGRTIIQNKETSVVFGMPGSAKARGCAEFELPLDRIAAKITELLNQ